MKGRLGDTPPANVAQRRSGTQRPVKSSAVHIEKGGHIFAALAVVDQLPGVVDLLAGEFWFASEFHPPALHILHSGAGPFAYQAAFQFPPVRQSSATWRGLSGSRTR